MKTTSWTLLFPLSTFLLFDFVQLNIMSVLSPYLIQKLSLSTQQLGFLSSLFFWVDCALLIPAGIVLDRYSIQWLVILSISIALLGIFIFMLSPSWKTALIWRASSGITGAFGYLSCIKMISTYFPSHQQGILIGGTGMVIMLAGVITQYPVQQIAIHYGLSMVFVIDIFFGLTTNLVLWLSKGRSCSLSPILTQASSHKACPYKQKYNWLLAFYACLINLPLFVLGALWGNLYLKTIYHFSLIDSSFITSMIFIGNMLGAPLLGFMSDKFKKRSFLMLVIAVVYFFNFIAILFVQTASFVLFTVLFFLLGFCSGAQTLSYAAVIEHNIDFNTAKSTSLLSLLSVGGGAVGQCIFGKLIGENNSYQKGVIFLIISASLCMMISMYISYEGRSKK